MTQNLLPLNSTLIFFLVIGVRPVSKALKLWRPRRDSNSRPDA